MAEERKNARQDTPRVPKIVTPSAAAASQTRPTPRAPINPLGESGQILIVDDDDHVRTFVRKVVMRLGYQPIEAVNGVEALAIVGNKSSRIKVVLTDINMPVMDGMELVRKLKQQPKPPAIAVMSGRFENDLRNRLHAAGITALLGKPFSLDELRRILQQAQKNA